MSLRTVRTAVATYDDGSEGVIEVSVLRPKRDTPFLTLSNPDSSDGAVIIGTAEQAGQLIAGIRAAASELENFGELT